MKQLGLIIATVALLSLTTAQAQMPTYLGLPAGATATACSSTGIFDLSNVCNDIYFIGALK